ncbi:MAG: hypothetical protein MK384_09520 [SAR202 cluster bacterium]|nr:hypothetical protein [SAR202 cluster bacterium]
MFRAAAIVFILSILLTTVASPTSTGANHEQGQPEHIFEGYVSLNREKLNDGFVRVTVGPGYGLQPPVQEVALEDIRQGRYEIGVVDPTDGKYSNVMLRFSVTYEGREYQRPRDVRLEPGKFTELNFDIEDWKWSRAQPQQVGEPSRGNNGMTDSQKAKLEMERERMEREDEERREMDRERMEMEEEMRREQLEMERERMEQDAEMRREQMAMSQQRMGRGEPGIQPVMNESPKSGPSRGLFSNRKAGEATSGIDNIMDPTTLTIIGIALTVLTTGMTLFKGN